MSKYLNVAEKEGKVAIHPPNKLGGILATKSYKMGNMSYCRFHNTALALEDCVDSWDDDDLSGMETRGKNTIIKLARQIVEMEEENNGKI